jgi:hypothetical protein
LVVLRSICERGGAAIHREEEKKKKQVDQFGQRGSSKFSSDKFGQSVQTCSDLHNDFTITLKSRQLSSCMSTSWNLLEVSFPMNETACPLAFPIKSYDRFSGGCTEG